MSVLKYIVGMTDRLVTLLCEISKSAERICCFNCGEMGHISVKCAKPLKKCAFCHRLGHLTKDCRKRLTSQVNTEDKIESAHDIDQPNKIMCITCPLDDPNNKYYKTIRVNGVERLAYIDLGSACSLISETDAKDILHNWHNTSELPNLRGFGNSTVQALSSQKALIEIGHVSAEVELIVVADHYMHVPIIIGQTFTENSNIMIYKTSNELIFVELPNFNFGNEVLKHKILINDNTVISSNSISPVPVHTPFKYSGSLFINKGVILISDKECFIVPGLYKFSDGQGYLMIANINKSDLTIKINHVIARGCVYKEVNDVYVGKTDISHEYKSLPLNDIGIGTVLNQNELKNFQELLIKYRDCFAWFGRLS
jgi:hypothetical protein